MENPAGTTALPMRMLILCSDAQFLESAQEVLTQLQVIPKTVTRCDIALSLIQREDFDVIMVDWRQIENFRDFFYTIHTSELNADCVLIAIVGDLLEMPQAHSAGVHFLIHKGSTAEQIARSLRGAHSDTLARRRKSHREPVHIEALIGTRTHPCGEAIVESVGEDGVSLLFVVPSDELFASLKAGEKIQVRFTLPGTSQVLQADATVLWSGKSRCGVRFAELPADGRLALESWLTACVQRSMEEARHTQSAISA